VITSGLGFSVIGSAMGKSRRRRQEHQPAEPPPELDPAKWSEFERALRRALTMPPHLHKEPTSTPKPKTRPASRGRVHKGKSRA
jgi:hypothetical protein